MGAIEGLWFCSSVFRTYLLLTAIEVAQYLVVDIKRAKGYKRR